MKQRRVEHVERRRRLVEFNLVSEDTKRAPSRRRGCLFFLMPSLLALVALLASIPGLR